MDFPFPCPRCGKDICKRAYTMNLALGYVDEQVCLPCLSKSHDQNIESMFDFIYGYVEGRDCFKKEWVKMKNKSECPLPENCVINKCFNQFLDLRGVECPLNFVKTKLQLEKMKKGEMLEVLLDSGEPVESVSRSVIEEGYEILAQKELNNYWEIEIKKTN